MLRDDMQTVKNMVNAAKKELQAYIDKKVGDIEKKIAKAEPDKKPGPKPKKG